MDVIVLDGQLKSALCVVRSLGAKDIVVTVGATRSSGLALHSRYGGRTFVYPDPKIDQEGFLLALIDQIEMSETAPLIYAFSDATHTLIQEQREQLEGKCHFFWAPTETYDIAFDKAASYSEAKLLGVPTIATWHLDNEEELKRRSSEFSYPMVVKPRRSVIWYKGTGHFGTASFAMDQSEARELFKEHLEKTGESPLLQECITGEEYGVEALALEGEVVAIAAHHRLRSMSPTGGASVLKETVTQGEDVEFMKSAARKLIEALNWTGPIMCEFKVDADNRTPYLMEINGRWWGSLPLSVAAGVDFPYLAYQLYNDDLDTTEVITAKAGVTSRHWLGDVRHLLRVFFTADPMRSQMYPRRKLALRDFFRVPNGTVSDVWWWRDIKPGLWEYIDVIKKFF